jgi:beta-lactamase regulating signal transducer with metallopeptidase domain
MTAIYATLFWCALQVTLFLTLASPIYLLVRRRSPHAAPFAAASSLAAVILLSALAASPWPRWSLSTAEGERVPLAGGSPTATDVGRDQATLSSTIANVAPGGDVPPNATSPLAALWEAVQFAATAPTSTTPPESPADETLLHWSTVVVALFLAGMVVSAAHLAAGLVAVRRLISGSRPLEDAALVAELTSLRQRLNIIRPVSLHESTEVATPATVGWRRPAILLPTAWQTWSDAERRAVLAHELAHIAQHDFAAWLVARAAIVVHFYHPLVRWFASRLQLDQELAADAAAVRLVGDRQQYLHALANLALATPTHRIAGPARTFIPGRSLLVRRLEMLRTNASVRPTTQPTSTLRWAVAPLLAALAVVAAGLRSPATAPLQAAEPEAAAIEIAPPRASSGYEFAYLPKDFVFLFAIRPSEIAASPHLTSLAEMMDENLRPKFKFEELEQMTFVVPVPVSDERGATIPGTGSEYTIFRTGADVDFKPLIEASYRTIRTDEYKGKQLIAWADPGLIGPIEYFSPVAGTLISSPRAQLTPVIDDPKCAEPPAAAVEWMTEAKGPLFGVVNIPALKRVSSGRSAAPFLPMFQPIFDLADDAIISVEDGDPVKLRASFNCSNPEDAARVEQTLQAMIVILNNMIAAQRAALLNGAAGSNPSPAPSMLPLLDLAGQVLAAAEVTANAGRVDVIASVKNPNETIRLTLIPQLQASKQAAMRNGTMQNLKQLGLAAHRYEAMDRSFPPAVFYGKSSHGDLNKSGENVDDVPRSWRVELLPFLGQEELYKQYRLDQPWDSEANLAVLRKMPDFFRSPNDEPKSMNTSYFAITGPGTVFDGKKGTPVAEIRDGLSNTLLLIEAKRDIPWTKPEDIAYAADQPIPALGGWRPGEFLVVLCDGSVHPVKNSEWVDKTFLRPWIGKADGQLPPPLWTPAPAP